MKNNLIILLLTLLGINSVIAQDVPCNDLNKLTAKFEAIQEVKRRYNSEVSWDKT